LRGPQNTWPAGPRRGLRGPGGQSRDMRGPAGRRPSSGRATKDGPIIQSNLFKSSPNAVVSLTGATASRLPSSCQSTHSLLAFVQCKTLRNLGVKILPISRFSNFFQSLTR